jgi:hypothetical protein
MDLGMGPGAASAQTLTAGARIAGLKVTESVCPYCAVGCGQLVYTRRGELVDIEGNPRSPINQDDAAVAAMGRGRRSLRDDQAERREARASSTWRSPVPLPDLVRRGYGEAVRLTSLTVERRLRRLRRSSSSG